MNWAACSRNDKTNVAILDGRQNAQKYTETLQSYLIPFLPRSHTSNWFFSEKMVQFTPRVTQNHDFKRKTIKTMG